MDGDDDDHLVPRRLHRGAQRRVRGAVHVVAARPGAARPRARRHGQLRGPPPHVRGRDRERPARGLNDAGEPGRARRGRARTRRRAAVDRLPGRVHAARPRRHRPGAGRAARRVRWATAWRSTTRAMRSSTSPSGSDPRTASCATRCSTPASSPVPPAPARMRASRCCSTGGWWRTRPSTRTRRVVLDAVRADAPTSSPTSRRPRRARVWVERLQMIGASLDPARYHDRAVRRRTAAPHDQLDVGASSSRADQVDTVTATLREFQPAIADAAPEVVDAGQAGGPQPPPPGVSMRSTSPARERDGALVGQAARARTRRRRAAASSRRPRPARRRRGPTARCVRRSVISDTVTSSSTSSSRSMPSPPGCAPAPPLPRRSA